MGVAPIALFTYNRPDHLRRTLVALKGCDLARKSDLFVFSDGPKTSRDEAAVAQVRAIVNAIDGFASVKVTTREQNHGLADSIAGGVTELCRTRGAVIALEDDLVVAPGYLRFMNEALSRYWNEKAVMQVSGYVLPMPRIKNLGDTFLCRVASSWGWATWDRAWSCFNTDSEKLLSDLSSQVQRHRFDVDGSYPYYDMLQQQSVGQLDVWGVRWYASMFRENGLCLYPTESLVQNIGMDGSGMHCNASTRFDVRLSGKEHWTFVETVEESGDAVAMISEFFRASGAGDRTDETTQSGPWVRLAARKWRSLIGRVRRGSLGRKGIL